MIISHGVKMDKRGKLKLIGIISLLVIISSIILISPVIETTNKKTYNSIEKKATIKDKDDIQLAEIQLIYNTKYCIKNCYADLIMDLSKSTENPFNKLSFYEKETMGEKLLDYSILVRTTSYTVTSDKYDLFCGEDIVTENGTASDCSIQLNGTKQELMWNWEDYDSNKDYEGEYYVRIKGQKQSGENIEWIPEFLDVEIDEWAEWISGGYDNGLEAYYPMENKTERIFGILNLHDGIGAPTFESGNCMDGNCINLYNGSNVMTSNSSIFSLNQPDKTINLWLKRRQVAVHEYLFYDITPPGTEHDIEFSAANPDKLEMWIGGAGGTTANAIIPTINEYVMITFVNNGTNYLIYTNGTLNSYLTGGNDNALAQNFSIGYREGPSFEIEAWMDELAYWNRSLTASEISDLYNGGTGLFYTSPQPNNYTIIFNLTDGDTGMSLDLTNPGDDYALSCDNGFSDAEVDDNPYNATNFVGGFVGCTFSDLIADGQRYFDETFNITADSNKTVEIQMSRENTMTQEEHDWLEAVYECLINGVGCYT